MARKQVKTERRRYLGWVMAILATGYFAYHAVHGGHGLIAIQSLEQDQLELMATLKEVERERLFLEHRVSLLRPESLDPDMLDERARALLNQAGKDDIILAIEKAAR